MSVVPSASIKKVKFSGGQELEFQPQQKILLVGPNNAGKSQTLREILQLCQHGKRTRPVVISDLSIEKVGTGEQLKKFMDKNAYYEGGVYRYKNWSIADHTVERWNQFNYLENGLSGGFIKNIDANDRLEICKQQESVGPAEQKTKPQHVLYDDSALMEKVSSLFRAAFGQDIMFDFRGGKYIPIHVGKPPSKDLVDRAGDAYVAAVRNNPLLDKQGDGMKSYAGILFETLAAEFDINLLDEPEAFLHPPQMRRLGETLASEVRGQLIVATHSSDIMRGFLEGTRGNVRVLRIRRSGQVNVVSEAAGDIIQELWSRPELRYSNALEGVFHEETVICEDDSDCRLFNAIADHIAAQSGQRWKDTAYVPTGGKHGIKKVAEVLRKIGVPVKAVFDIDFLNDRALVKDTVLAFGGTWEDFEGLWNSVRAAVEGGVKPKSNESIKDDLISIIREWNDGKPPRGDLLEALKQTSSWSLLKKFGSRAIPRGEAQVKYAELKDRLESIGIYIVPVGEVENFCPDLGSHGPKFVNKLLAQVSFDDTRLGELRSFVEHIHMNAHAPLASEIVGTVAGETQDGESLTLSVRA